MSWHDSPHQTASANMCLMSMTLCLRDQHYSHPWENISPAIIYFFWDVEMIKICIRHGPAIPLLMIKLDIKKQKRHISTICLASRSQCLACTQLITTVLCTDQLFDEVKKCQLKPAVTSSVNPQKDVLEQLSLNVWLTLCRAACTGNWSSSGGMTLSLDAVRRPWRQPWFPSCPSHGYTLQVMLLVCHLGNSHWLWNRIELHKP